MGRGGVSLEGRHGFPFLDDDEGIRPESRLRARHVDRRAVLDAACLGEDRRDIRLEGFEYGGALSGALR